MKMRNSEFGIRHSESAIRPPRSAPRPRGAVRLIVLGAGLVRGLAGGCVLAPRQPSVPAPASPPSPPPGTSGDAKPAVTVDANRTVGENTTFHKSATERQKFQVHIDFGKVFETQGNLDRALQEYQDALKVAEGRGHGDLTAADEALAHRRIASALDRLGQFAQSEPHYQKARKLAPKDPKVWNDAGYSYYLQGRWGDAERALRTAIEARPGRREGPDEPGHDPRRRREDRRGPSAPEHQRGRRRSDTRTSAICWPRPASTTAARQEYQTALSMRPDLPVARRALVQLDRQERGIAAPPTTAIARNVPHGDGRRIGYGRSPGHAGRRCTDPDEILPPPLPPLRFARVGAESRPPLMRGRSFPPVGRGQDVVEPRPAIGDPVDLVPARDADQVLLPRGAGSISAVRISSESPAGPGEHAAVGSTIELRPMNRNPLSSPTRLTAIA